MKTNTRTTCTWGLLLLAAAMTTPANAAPPSGFTYQGQLKHRGLPVNGEGRFTFTLWDAETEGRQIGPVVEARAEIVNGLFTVQLDFGVGAFQGEPRWLETFVATTQGEGRLSPRQPITPAPFALYALDAPGGGGGELTLPFAGTNATNAAAISITNSGLAPAATFLTDNAGNAQAAVLATTTGSGPALLATTGGSGSGVWALTGDGGGMAGFFKVQGTSATQDALGVENAAMGSAGHFKTTKRENTSPALVAETFSDGPAATFTTHSDPNNVNLGPTVAAENDSFGMAGQFAILNSESTGDALRASTIGGGNAIHAYTNGLGRAGFVEVDNFGQRTVPAFEAVSNGRGAGAGLFRTTSALNTAAALTAESSGGADAILGTAQGLGAAVKGYNAFGGGAVVGLVEGGTGRAGSFTITQGVNPDPALEAITNGLGPAARFTQMNTGGQAADFIGDVSIAGTVAADAYTYPQPREHYLSLTPYDFTPNDGGQPWTRQAGPAGAAVIAGNSSLGDSNFVCAPVHLPQGATVTSVLAHYHYSQDLIIFDQLKVELNRRRLWNGQDTAMATLLMEDQATPGSYSMETSAIAEPVIDNRDFGYWVFAGLESPCPYEFWGCAAKPVYGVVITYTVTDAD